MPKSQHIRYVTKLTRVLALILVIALPIGGFYFGRLYERTQSEQIKVKYTTEQTSIQQKEEVLYTNKAQIKQFDLNGTWTNDGFFFTLKSAYLTPNIADISRYKDYIHGYENYKNSAFLVLEMSVRNVYTSGKDREINVKDNFSLKDKIGIQSLPLAIQYYSLSPQEDLNKVFVYFPVNNAEKQFSLYVGTARPRIIDLSFEGDKAKELQGFWIYRDGYSPEYYNRNPLFEYFK